MTPSPLGRCTAQAAPQFPVESAPFTFYTMTNTERTHYLMSKKIDTFERCPSVDMPHGVQQYIQRVTGGVIYHTLFSNADGTGIATAAFVPLPTKH